MEPSSISPDNILRELPFSLDESFKISDVKGLYVYMHRPDVSLVEVPVLSKSDGTVYLDPSRIMKGYSDVTIKEYPIFIYGERFLIFCRNHSRFEPVQSLRFLPGRNQPWRGDLLILRLDDTGKPVDIGNFIQQIQAMTALLCFSRGGEDYIASQDLDRTIQARIYNPDMFLLCQINKLPFDIVSDIFEWCMPHLINERAWFLFPTPYGAPFVFLNVCKQWRDFALSSSSFWTSVSSPLFSPEPIIIPHQQSFFNQWLDFSRLPLYIRHDCPHRLITKSINGNGRRTYNASPIYSGSSMISSLRAHALGMLAILLAKEKRWATFEAVFHKYEFSAFIDAIVSHRTTENSVLAVELTRLKLRLTGIFDDNNDRVNMQHLLSWIGDLPALVELDLKDSIHSLIGDISSLTLDRLRRICLEFQMTTGQSAQILSGCRVAEVVILRAKYVSQSKSIPLPQINSMHNLSSSARTLSCLTHLQLIKIQHPIFLLSQFNLPALEDLVVVSGLSADTEAVPLVPLFSKFLDQSQCHLKRLVLWDNTISTEDAFNFMRLSSEKRVTMMALHFFMCEASKFESLMTDDEYRWFRHGADFIAWTHKCNHDEKGQNHSPSCMEYIVGWKQLKDLEVLRWKVVKGMTYQYLYDDRE